MVVDDFNRNSGDNVIKKVYNNSLITPPNILARITRTYGGRRKQQDSISMEQLIYSTMRKYFWTCRY